MPAVIEYEGRHTSDTGFELFVIHRKTTGPDQGNLLQDRIPVNQGMGRSRIEGSPLKIGIKIRLAQQTQKELAGFECMSPVQRNSVQSGWVIEKASLSG